MLVGQVVNPVVNLRAIDNAPNRASYQRTVSGLPTGCRLANLPHMQTDPLPRREPAPVSILANGASMSVAEAVPEKRIILDRVSWTTYERLLEEHVDSLGTRFAYDGESLEIMVVYHEHEELNRTLAALVEAIAMARKIYYCRTGSTTFKRDDLHRGFEPDSSFYFENANAIRGKRRIDLNVDPPPDLILETDISRDSLNRFPIYASLGVPEVWRFHEGRVLIYVRREAGYERVEQSICLPPMTPRLVSSYLPMISNPMNGGRVCRPGAGAAPTGLVAERLVLAPGRVLQAVDEGCHPVPGVLRASMNCDGRRTVVRVDKAYRIVRKPVVLSAITGAPPAQEMTDATCEHTAKSGYWTGAKDRLHHSRSIEGDKVRRFIKAHRL